MSYRALAAAVGLLSLLTCNHARCAPISLIRQPYIPGASTTSVTPTDSQPVTSDTPSNSDAISSSDGPIPSPSETATPPTRPTNPTRQSVPPVTMEDTVATTEPVPDQQQQQNASKAAADVKRSVEESIQAALTLNNYIRGHQLAQDATPEGPCFQEERSASHAHHLDSRLNYLQRMADDYQSLKGYALYMNQTEESECTLNPNASAIYCMYITDLKTAVSDLKKYLKFFISIWDPSVLLQSSGNSTAHGEALEEGLSHTYPAHCYDTSYEQQSRTYLEFLSLARYYITEDVNGVLQEE